MEITLFKVNSTNPKAPAFSGFMEVNGKKVDLVAFNWTSAKVNKNGVPYQGIRVVQAIKKEVS